MVARWLLQMVVAAVCGDRIAVGLQGLDASARTDQAADLPSCVGVARVTIKHLDHIRHRGHDGLGLLAIARTQPLQFLLAAVVEISHAFDEHLGQVVTGLYPSAMDQAQQECVSLGLAEVAQLGGVQHPGFGGKMLALEFRYVRQMQFAADQFVQRSDMVDQFLEVSQRGALGQPLDGLQWALDASVGDDQKNVQTLLLVRRQPRVDEGEVTTIDQGANPAPQAIQRGKRRQLDAVADKLFDRHVDQVGRIVHDGGGFVDGAGRHVEAAVGIGSNLKIIPDALEIAVALVRRDVGWLDLDPVPQRVAEVPDDRSGHFIDCGEVAQSLEGF